MIQNRFFAATAALAISLAGCADRSPTMPLTAASAPLRSVGSSATLLECPTDLSVSTSGTVDAVGGTLSVIDAAGGTHQVTFPPNAVLLPTVFRFEVPASQYVKVRVTATDAATGEPMEISFPADARPVLAVSYKRCTRNNTGDLPLQLYNVDEVTNEVLEGPFGAKEGNPEDPRVVGSVPHFSDYSLGSP